MNTKFLRLLAGASLVLVGCASPSKVVNAKIQGRIGTNTVFEIEQPKDTVIRDLEYRSPEGASLVIKGYSSTGNAAAIAATEAQIQAQSTVATGALQSVNELVKLGQAFAAAYMNSKGLPAAPPAPAPAAAPAVMPFTGTITPNNGVTAMPRAAPTVVNKP